MHTHHNWRVGSRYILTALVALLILGVLYVVDSVVRKSAPVVIVSTTHTILFTDQGFQPAELQIKTGDTVTFTSNQAESFWPASDPHPTHTTYPEFDSKQAIDNGNTWQFTFTKPGTWYFHDHISVANRGKIIVGSEAAFAAVSVDCHGASNSEHCWQEAIEHAIQTGGLDAGWEVFSKLSQSGSPVACHWASHLIGEEVAHEYIAGRDFTLSNKTAYCGYGFYHGFMETALRDDPDPAKAVAFCALVGEKLGNNAQDNCFHGVGHGFTEEPPPAGTIGNANAMLKPGLGVCEELFGNIANKWSICATGVYTVIVGYMADGKYGLAWDPKDPFTFCRTQPERYYEACFGEIGPKLDYIVQGNVTKVPALMGPMPSQNIADLVMRSSIAGIMQRDVSLAEHTTFAKQCHQVPSNLQPACFEGVVMGLSPHFPSIECNSGGGHCPTPGVTCY